MLLIKTKWDLCFNEKKKHSSLERKLDQSPFCMERFFHDCMRMHRCPNSHVLWNRLKKLFSITLVLFVMLFKYHSKCHNLLGFSGRNSWTGSYKLKQSSNTRKFLSPDGVFLVQYEKPFLFLFLVLRFPVYVNILKFHQTSLHFSVGCS